MYIDKTLQCLLEEHGRLRVEIGHFNRIQFQLCAAVSLGVVGGFGAWFSFLKDQPFVLLLLASLTLAQIILSIEFRLRTRLLSHRLATIESQLQAVCGTQFVMRWESEYVPRMFSPMDPDSRSRFAVSPHSRCVRAVVIQFVHAAFIIPLFLVYVLCICMAWVVPVQLPLLWTALGLVVPLALGFGYVVAEQELRRRVRYAEDKTCSTFKQEIKETNQSTS